MAKLTQIVWDQYIRRPSQPSPLTEISEEPLAFHEEIDPLNEQTPISGTPLPLKTRSPKAAFPHDNQFPQTPPSPLSLAEGGDQSWSECTCPSCTSNPLRRNPDQASTTLGGGVTAAPSAPVSLQTLATYLTTGYWQEAGTYKRKYNLTSSGTGANSGILTYNLSGWTKDSDGLGNARRTLAREIFKVYAAVLGISFQEVTGDSGDIRFTDNDTGAYAYAATGWYDNSLRTSVTIDYSVVNIEPGWYDGNSNYSTYVPQTFFHEIGHALGLGHQGLYNYTGTPLTYDSSAKFANDSWQESMMSYWDQVENTTTGASFAWLQTPMAVDWIALNDLYTSQGYSTANAFSDNTIYGVNTNIDLVVSEIWNRFSTYVNTTAYTIVDGGGYDTLDVSNFSVDQLINLSPSQTSSTVPALSNIGGLIKNVSIAAGTIIEAAKGGNGDDRFYGNSVNNSFYGGNGNDSFNDSLGSDSYWGDGGNSDLLLFTEPANIIGYEIGSDASSLLFSRFSSSTDLDRAWNSIETFSFNENSYSYNDLVQRLTGPALPTATINSISNLASGSTTRSTNLSFSGSLSSSLSSANKIAIYRNGSWVGFASYTSGNTNWTFNLQESSGSNNFTYTARVIEGNPGRLGSASNPFLLTVDTIAPVVTVSSLNTKDTTPLLQGTVNDPDAVITVTIGSSNLQATNNHNGTWGLNWSSTLNFGRYNVSVTATDAAGNSSSDNTSNELIIANPRLYFSLASAVTTASSSVMGGLIANTNDIIAVDSSNQFTTWLNGNASGLSGAAIRDFEIITEDEVVVAFQNPVTLAGIAFDDSDLAKLNRTASGWSLSMFFDGSDVGLTTSGEAIDAVTGLSDGTWLISTRGSGGVTGVSSFPAEDILLFTPFLTSTGDNTAGSWSLYADMSDVGVSGTAENIVAADVASDGKVYLTTSGNFSVTGLSGANEDIFVLQPSTLGNTTAGSFVSQLSFDGSLYGLGNNAIMGFSL